MELYEEVEGDKIKNNDPGIPGIEIDKLCKPFFRGNSSQAINTEGKGLGLVIVEKAVKLLSGAGCTCLDKF